MVLPWVGFSLCGHDVGLQPLNSLLKQAHLLEGAHGTPYRTGALSPPQWGPWKDLGLMPLSG